MISRISRWGLNMNYLNKENHKEYSNDMAVLIVSYDGYSDLWDDFFNLLNLNWSDRAYPTYLANNTKPANYDGVEVINCGENAQWSTRTRFALSQIKEPYVCLLLEDYFIGQPVDGELIKNALDLLKNDRLKYYKLNSFSKISTDSYKGLDYLKVIPKNLEYGISLQAAIWDKKYLIDLIGSGDYNAWKFEVDRIRETNTDTESPIIGCVYDNRNILNICHGVAQGKFLPPAIRYFKRRNYLINTSKRTVMSKREYLYYNLKGKGKFLIPKKLRSNVKQILNRFGFKFITADKKNN